MKHLIFRTFGRHSRISTFGVAILTCLASLYGLSSYGQNVTISPSSGNLIAALTYDNEAGFERGWSALWRHKQLPLALHVSDKPDLTSSGVLKDPAGNIRLDKDRNLYVVMGGSIVTTHMSISLPKGYRFTGYRMVLLNDMNGKKSYGGFDIGSINKRMYETNSSFDYNNALASTATMGSTNETKDYVIERTSKSETDMGNNLYFYFWREEDAFYAATIKSIELYFTAEAQFQAEGVPGSPSEIIQDGVNMVGTDFTTGKLDLGVIKPNTKSGVTYYSYDYQNVIDLTAKNWLYQEDAVKDGKLPETAGSGNIQVLRNDGQLYYALGNGTYYIETPTETTNQNGKPIPLGYRITGAQIKAHYGTKAASSKVTYDGKTGTISAKWYRTTYNLKTDGTWTTGKGATWTLTKTGKLQSGNYYLSVQKNTYTRWGQQYTQYIANGTTDINAANAFTLSNGHVMYGELILSITSEDRAGFYEKEGSSNNFASWITINSSTTNPAYTPSAFKLELYGTDGKSVQSTFNMSSNTKDATAKVSGLNNDAVKFTISGLAEGTKALITYNLTMEQLNPFINTLDIVCHSAKAEGLKISQQFTSNDFQVAGGQFLFYIPSDFVGETKKCKFTFENLTSKYMDDTYGKGTTGNSRNFLVKSPYYNTYGDGNQYNATGYEDAADKVRTEMCGNVPYKYNNAAELEAAGSTATASTLEEYPYSEQRYKEQGGSFTENIEIRVNDPAKECYLMTGDETRYNIAPTTAMEHRYYAYYLMDIQLLVKDYDAKCQLKKLYETTFYDDGTDPKADKPMYGGTFEAYESGHSGDPNYKVPSEKAYLTVNMMKEALVDALNKVGAQTNQVLYLDYTNLYSVLVESKESMSAMKSVLNPNCLIFFPERTTFDEDNYVQKTKSGGFRACKNIVITDKQPFFSPYKIMVPTENYAAYTRKITNAMNGKATLATLVLPFSISVSEGVHSNDNCSFTLYQMQADDCMNIDKENTHEGGSFWSKAKFHPFTGNLTVPNTPYVVKVDKGSAGEDVTFEVQQYGSDVEATVSETSETGNFMGSDYTFKGETAKGTIGGAAHTFTHLGSYSGKKLPKADGWFYFAKGRFYNSKNLADKYDAVYVYPFRAYFAHSSVNGAKQLDGFDINFDDDWTTGIEDVENEKNTTDLKLSVGHGTLSVTAVAATNVNVVSPAGVTMHHASLGSGESVTLNLSSGLYVVNGKKVIIP